MREVHVQAGAAHCSYQVYRFGSGNDKVCFTAGVHGDEVTGIYVAQQLVAYLESHPPVKGCVEIIPIVNQLAHERLVRRCPVDNLDLNRVFPGEPNGSLSEALAWSVYNETRDAATLVDLHCCGGFGLPYVLSVYSEAAAVRDLVSRITLPNAIHSEGTEGQLFTEATRRRGQAACVIELPSAYGRGAINLAYADDCLEALLNLLRSLGMLHGDVTGSSPCFLGKLKDREVRETGTFFPLAAKGRWVKGGEVAGSLLGQPVYFEEDGLLMAIKPFSYLTAEENWLYTYAQPEQA